MSKLLLFLSLQILISHVVYSQTITTKEPIQTSLCAGGNIIVEFETEGAFNINTIFTAQLSNSLGSFNNPVNIGSTPVNTGIIFGTIPSNTQMGINYRVRVISNNPQVTGSASPNPPIVISSSAISAAIVAFPSDNICAGNTTTLSVSPNEKYFWSTGDTTQSIQVSQAGIYSVTVTNYITSCQVTAPPKEVTVLPLPIINLGKDTSICENQTLTLEADSIYSYYNWNNGMSYAHQITADTSGLYHVMVIDANGCQNRDSISITVNNNPLVNIGPDTTICGVYYQLYATPGYYSYNWNNGLSYNPSLSVSQTDLYFVTVKDSNGCYTRDTAYVEIFLPPLVNLGNDFSACGSNVILNAGNGFSNYNWNNGAGSEQYFSVSNSGLNFVIVTDSNNCSATDSVFVAINPIPQVFLGNDTTINLNDILLLDAGGGFANYYWNTGSTSQTISIKAADYGIGNFFFEVLVLDSNYCYNTAGVYVDIIENTGEKKVDIENNINIFPNPIRESFSIVGISQNDNFSISLTDLTGRKITPRYLFKENAIEVYRDDLEGGIYILSLIKNEILIKAVKIAIL